MTVFPYSKAFRLLDASRPIAAFEVARRYRPGAYALTTLAKAAGSVASSTGVSMNAIGLARARARHVRRRSSGWPEGE
jgi:hypothetical protein